MSSPPRGSTPQTARSPAGKALPQPTDDLETAVRAIWERRKPHVVERVVALDRAASALASGSLDEARREEARAQAHKLAGSAGTFGFAEASRLAQAAERMLEPRMSLGAADAERLRDLAAALRRDLEGEPQAP